MKSRLSEQQTDDLVRTILEIVSPRSLYLFGSAARGAMTAASDIDVLVVMPTGTDCRRTAQALYMATWDFPHPLDFVVISEDRFEDARDDVGTVVYPAYREGRKIYAA